MRVVAPERKLTHHPQALIMSALVLCLALVLCAAPVAAQTIVVETAHATSSIVGPWSSLALDAAGNPHVSYLDNTTNDLNYAEKSGGVWTIVIAEPSANSVGNYTSLALDASGNPHIAHYDGTASDLRYTRRVGAVWTSEAIDVSADIVGVWASLALDASGNPHVTYQNATIQALKYARKSGGLWTTEFVNFVGNLIGAYASLALDAVGNPHVSYLDATVGDLKYARKVGGTWTIETADASSNDVGWYTSIALDGSGNPHISYTDNTLRDVKYARRIGGAWIVETVDASNHDGDYTAIALDALGNARISYHDATTTDLKYARRLGSAWTIELVDGVFTDVGYMSSLALDASGDPHITYYDQSATDLKYAYMPSIVVGSPGAGTTWAVGSSQTISWSFTGGLPTGNADVFLSVDGGGTFQLIRDEARDFAATTRVPHLPTRFAQVKVIRASPFTVGYSDSFFTINATISLAKFDATRRDDVTRLTWETNPGPEADIRYRVERGSEGSFISIADGIDRGEFVDQSPATASRYRLIAINGLGEEYVLGETSVTGALAADRDIVAYPNPASGPIEILYRVPVERAIDLSVYDASGRRTRSLSAGRVPVGVQSASWDRRDDGGNEVAAGIYFLRLRVGDGHEATERITIVR